MRTIKASRHAEKRINRGDKKGLRTHASVDELISNIASPSAVKVGRYVYFWSAADKRALKVVTAQQGKVIVTVHDVEREPGHELIEMLTKQRADGDPGFVSAPQPRTLTPERAAHVSLGVIKKKRDEHILNEYCDVCSWFDVDSHSLAILRSRAFHQSIVDAVEGLRYAEQLSKKQLREMQAFIRVAADRKLGSMPVWISYELLELESPLG